MYTRFLEASVTYSLVEMVFKEISKVCSCSEEQWSKKKWLFQVIKSCFEQVSQNELEHKEHVLVLMLGVEDIWWSGQCCLGVIHIYEKLVVRVLLWCPYPGFGELYLYQLCSNIVVCSCTSCFI